jgi:hypothetical protein
LAFVFGAPYLTWKLVSSDDSEIPEDVKKSEGWKTGNKMSEVVTQKPNKIKYKTDKTD